MLVKTKCFQIKLDEMKGDPMLGARFSRKFRKELRLVLTNLIAKNGFGGSKFIVTAAHDEEGVLTIFISETRKALWQRLVFMPTLLLKGLLPWGFVIGNHRLIWKAIDQASVVVCEKLGIYQ